MTDELFIYYSVTLLIVGIMFGYCFGSLSAIREDIKSISYDELKYENEQLKRAIQIKKKRKKND